MRVAVQGCSHGSLSAIYDTVAEYTRRKGEPVDLLLLCGDFQALRNNHDFASLAVPPKYHALGTFHEYYSGARVAPVLTIVIGGNHEASNYMWELYHGGWLAPNIYYLGCAGSVMVNGLRIVGSSGIYKEHDYRKGHFEKVPYTPSTLRSVYHTRKYDVEKLSHLPPDVPTIFLSHDWPIGIAHHGNTRALLQRKKFFRTEVENNTLGSPPMLELMKKIQPDYWFAAHLHVKFAAMYEHGRDEKRKEVKEELKETRKQLEKVEVTDAVEVERRESVYDDVDLGGRHANPDEIVISDDDDDVPSPTKHVSNPDEIAISDDDDAPPLKPAAKAVGNPDEIAISDDEGEPANPDEIAVSLSDDELEDELDAALAMTSTSSEPTPAAEDPSPQPTAPASPSPAKREGPSTTRFLALDKCGHGKEFIQFLDIPAPGQQSPPRLTFDPHWLAITRALHPYLSLEVYGAALPPREEQEALVADELARIKEEGVLVPEELIEDDFMADMNAEFEAIERRESAAERAAAGLPEEEEPSGDPKSESDPLPQCAPLDWESADNIEVGRVQQFWPTAPPYPGGDAGQWYTNPQTEAFCGMLGIQNKVNPRPVLR
ncbi:hypothetical protein CspeluHIS016_0404580 [Cutaneotrichosporon spelunceum]|uniref:Lariat debranching enzyme C-terminal domain-containing protein n=1 Tax=Cutaneotrichosporon spelunceum TaxID=1672016 RepID=A0AAD3YD80_9TREE|nr:hypothetical protein CspeluHIS016_0404580 [Cutaneotrichosporon spelunceum]